MVLLVQRERRQHQRAAHLAGVVDDADAVAPHLVPEHVGRNSDARARRAPPVMALPAATSMRGGVVQRQAAVHGVAIGERAGGGGAERREGPAPVGDAAGSRRREPAARHEHHRQVARSSGIRTIPGGQRRGVGVDGLEIDGAGGQVRALVGAAEDQQLAGPRAADAGGQLGIRDHQLALADVEGAPQRGVGGGGRDEDGDRADAQERGHRRQVAGAAFHEDGHASGPGGRRPASGRGPPRRRGGWRRHR